MLKKEVFRPYFGIIVIMLMSLFASGAFDIQNQLIKITLNKGELVNRTLSLSSNTNDRIKILSGAPWLEVYEKEVSIGPGETKKVNLIFNISQVLPGVYVSNISLKSEDNQAFVPVILEVQSGDLFFDSNLEIPPQYAEVKPGEKIVAQVKVFDLATSRGISKGLGSTSVKVEYEIKDFSGRIIYLESEDVTVNGQAAITKTIPISSAASPGDYLVSATSKYKSSTGTSSKIFRIANISENPDNKTEKGISLEFYLIVLVGLFILIIFLLFFVYFLKDRDKLLLELRKYNSTELRRQQLFLREQAKILYNQGKNKELVEAEIKEKIRHIKKRHRRRISELKEMKKRNAKKSDMLKKINLWKKEGYNTFSIEYKLKDLKDEDMKLLMDKWKEEGYERQLTEGYKNPTE